jgi:hypothetical protein
MSFTTIALVDSGATATFMPTDFIGILGLHPKQEEMAVGVGGVIKVYKEKIDRIEVIHNNKVFCELKNVEVLFPSGFSSIPYGVLGRDGVFKKYDIIFREEKQQIVFKRPK